MQFFKVNFEGVRGKKEGPKLFRISDHHWRARQSSNLVKIAGGSQVEHSGTELIKIL